MTIEAMKQALEALEIGWSPKYVNGVDAREKGMAAITSLRQAIAEAEKQEPVAWVCRRKTGGLTFVYTNEQLNELGYGNISVAAFDKIQPLYTSPSQRQWVGLTQEEKREAWWSCPMATPTEFANAIEAKLKEKNT